MIKFKEFIIAEENAANKINTILDLNEFVLFFEKDGEVFAANEDSRVVFAKMKNPKDEGVSDGWLDEATFSAININKMAKGEPSQHIFKKDDLKKIKVIDKEEAVEKIKKEVESLGNDAFPRQTKHLNVSDPSDKGSIPNFVRTDEE